MAYFATKNSHFFHHQKNFLGSEKIFFEIFRKFSIFLLKFFFWLLDFLTKKKFLVPSLFFWNFFQNFQKFLWHFFWNFFWLFKFFFFNDIFYFFPKFFWPGTKNFFLVKKSKSQKKNLSEKIEFFQKILEKSSISKKIFFLVENFEKFSEKKWKNKVSNPGGICK